MADFKLNGFTYEIIHKPKNRKECLKWKTGYRNFWERISINEYNDMILKYKNNKHENNIGNT